MTDQQLLRDDAEHRSEAAFAELVRRQWLSIVRTDLFKGAAIRQTSAFQSADHVGVNALTRKPRCR